MYDFLMRMIEEKMHVKDDEVAEERVSDMQLFFAGAADADSPSPEEATAITSEKALSIREEFSKDGELQPCIWLIATEGPIASESSPRPPPAPAHRARARPPLPPAHARAPSPLLPASSQALAAAARQARHA